MADRTHADLGNGERADAGAPDQAEPASPPPHTDGPSDRPERSTGAGREATEADREGTGHTREHRSGYGGKGGRPDTSSDKR